MKPTWSDLSPTEQATFGNGCTLVPDFIFTANCRQHDFNYSRAGGLYDKIKADFDMCSRMFNDALDSNHPVFFGLVTFVYYIGLTFLPVSYFYFTWGEYKSIKEILESDRKRMV